MFLVFRNCSWGGEGSLHGQCASGRRRTGTHKTSLAWSRYDHTGIFPPSFQILISRNISDKLELHKWGLDRRFVFYYYKYVSNCIFRLDPWHSSNNHQQSMCVWHEVNHDGSSESNVWTPGTVSITVHTLSLCCLLEAAGTMTMHTCCVYITTQIWSMKR